MRKTALVLGGDGFIGAEIAAALSRDGIRVLLMGTEEDKLKETANGIGQDCIYLTADVLQAAETAEKMERASRMLGGLDYFIYSVGIHIGTDFWNMTEQMFDDSIGTGIRGFYFSARAAADVMRKSGHGGGILVVNSLSCIKPALYPGQLSKWAMKGFVQGLAAELEDARIRVYGIAPSRVVEGLPEQGETRLSSIGRLAVRLLAGKKDSGNEYRSGDTIFC